MLWKSVLNLFHLDVKMAIAELSIMHLLVKTQEKCEIGLVNNHYFNDGTTGLTAYSLEHYDGVKDIAGCHLIYKSIGKCYNKGKSGKRFIKAFQLFKLLRIILVSLFAQCL